MQLWRTRVLLILSLFTMISIGHTQAAGEKIASADQAIKRAVRFLNDVGQTVDAHPVATFPVNVLFPYAWQVEAGKMKVRVDNRTGHICNVLRTDSYKRGTVGITENDALAPKKYLTAAGISLSDAQLYQNEMDESAGIWRVGYHRVHNGIRFNRNFIHIHLRPGDGDLDGFGYRFDSPLPESISKRMTKDAAVLYGRKYMAQLAGPTGNLVSANLMIVQPDYSWEYREMGLQPPKPIKSRYAWVIRYDAPWSATIVWVDAENGSVLGGNIGMGPFDTISKKSALSSTEKVVVTQSGKTTLPDVKSSRIQNLITAINDLHHVSEIPKGKLPITLKFQGRERSYTFGYSSKEHRLVLLDKKYMNIPIKGRSVWETSKRVEEIMQKCCAK